MVRGKSIFSLINVQANLFLLFNINQDYNLWCDLRALEERLGKRWLTHESDDVRWESYRRQINLHSPYRVSSEPRTPLVERLVDIDDNNRNGSNNDSRHNNGTNLLELDKVRL